MFGRFLCWLGFHSIVAARTHIATDSLDGKGIKRDTASETIKISCIREHCKFTKEV